jgi:nicotinamide mononucleotide adenylyltransferase
MSVAHHEPARNPLSLWERIRQLHVLWRQEIANARVTVVPIPRPQGPKEWWNVVTAFLPSDRFWVLKWDDEFEAAKARFFESVGEETVVIGGDDPSVMTKRGGELREMLATGEAIDRYVPSPIAQDLMGFTSLEQDGDAK